MKSWFEGILTHLSTVGAGPNPRSKALTALGISTKDNFRTFRRKFKKSWGKKTPRTADERVKVEYKRNLLEAKMKYILQMSWPSQKKRGVSDIGDEEERLLTLLYYTLQEANLRGGKTAEDTE